MLSTGVYGLWGDWRLKGIFCDRPPVHKSDFSETNDVD